MVTECSHGGVPTHQAHSSASGQAGEGRDRAWAWGQLPIGEAREIKVGDLTSGERDAFVEQKRRAR